MFSHQTTLQSHQSLIKMIGRGDGAEVVVKIHCIFSGMYDETEGFTSCFSYFSTFSFYSVSGSFKRLGSWGEYEENSFREKIKTWPSNKPSSVTVHISQTKSLPLTLTHSAGLWNKTSPSDRSLSPLITRMGCHRVTRSSFFPWKARFSS